MKTLEERIAAGSEAIEEEERKHVAVRPARRLRRLHKLGEIAAEEKAVGPTW